MICFKQHGTIQPSFKKEETVLQSKEGIKEKKMRQKKGEREVPRKGEEYNTQ